jgi:signal transduction histidine kinase
LAGRGLPTIFRKTASIRTGLTYALIAIALGALFALLLSRTINRQLLLLFQGAQRFSQNQLKKPIPVVTENEIGTVTRAFNEAMRKVDQQQEDLRQAVSARDEFFSVASHELKTPITSLKLRLHLMEKQLDGISKEEGTKLGRSLQLAGKQVDRLVTLMNKLLDVSRVRSGKLDPSREEFDLSVAMEELIEQCAPDFEAAGCEPQVEIEPGIVGCWDRLRIEQVVLNLISNALKYAPGSPVRFALKREEGNAVLSVRDRGIGIPLNQQERIFDPFERIVDCREVTGLGLGLFIAKEIVTAHRGRILLKSASGEGSEFTVVLPDRA